MTPWVVCLGGTGKISSWLKPFKAFYFLRDKLRCVVRDFLRVKDMVFARGFLRSWLGFMFKHSHFGLACTGWASMRSIDRNLQ